MTGNRSPSGARAVAVKYGRLLIGIQGCSKIGGVGCRRRCSMGQETYGRLHRVSTTAYVLRKHKLVQGRMKAWFEIRRYSVR